MRAPSTELLLSIGGLAGRVVLGAAPQPFISQARARYGAFTMPASPDVATGFSLRLALEPSPPVAPAGVAAHLADTQARPLTVKATDKSITTTRWDLTCAAGQARGRRPSGWHGPLRHEPVRSMRAARRVVGAVSREDALLVHSCGLRQPRSASCSRA
jgi:hypothetical protein